MKTKTLLMIAAGGVGYLAFRGHQAAPAVPVTPGNLTTLVRAGWNAVAPKGMATVAAPVTTTPPSSTPAALAPTTPATTPAAQGYFSGYGYSE